MFSTIKFDKLSGFWRWLGFEGDCFDQKIRTRAARALQVASKESGRPYMG